MTVDDHVVWQSEWGATVWGASLDLGALSKRGMPIRLLTQTHGVVVHTDQTYRDGREGDGLVTDQTDTLLAVRTADCVPVHISDGNRTAMLHAGWRGTAAGIVDAVRTYFDPAEVRVVIGPSIHGKRYEVDEDLYGPWLEQEAMVGDFLTTHHPGSSKRLFDLRGLVRRKLEAMGVASESIKDIPICTFDSDLPSYRRQGKAAQRIFNYVYRSSK